MYHGGGNTYYNSSKLAELADGVVVTEIKSANPVTSEQQNANFPNQYNGSGNGRQNNSGGGYHNKGHQNNNTNNNQMWQQQQNGGNRYNNRNGNNSAPAPSQNGGPVLTAPAGAPVNAQVPVVSAQVPVNPGANPQPDRYRP